MLANVWQTGQRDQIRGVQSVLTGSYDKAGGTAKLWDAANILKYYAGLIACFPADTDCDGNGPETGS